MRCEYLSKDANYMEIVVGSMKVVPFVRHPAPFLCESGLVIKVNNYNLEGVILACMEDYGIEKVMEMINSLRSDTESLYVPEKQPA